MTKWAKNNNYEKPIICSVNMAASQSSSNVKGGIMRAMLKKISKGLNIENDEPLAKFEKLMMKRVVVLVVDEIDMLFKQHGGIGETWFKTLVSWAEDKEMRFSLIGISNCVNDNDSARVRELGHVRALVA
jgi:Cdc6-like AAA superfamily ATPase